MITHVGTLLRDERKKQHLSIEAVEKRTHIRAKNLRAIEAERWEDFPSSTYVHGIITQYGRFLGLDTQKLTAYFRRAYEHHENIKFKERTKHSQFVPKRKIAIRIAMVGIFMFFTLFFGYQVYLYIRPPEVTLLEPTQTVFKRTDKVLVRGHATEESIVHVNGKEVPLNDEQVFSTFIPLVERRTLVEIKVTGANGRTATVRRVLTNGDIE